MTPTGSAPFCPVDEAKADQRTVRNWQIPSQRVRGELPIGAAFPWQSQTVIDVVNRTLQAVKFARQDGRISQDQEDGVVAQYNIAWP